MTREGEILVLREHLAVVDRLAATLHKVRSRVAGALPMTADAMRALDDDLHIDVLASIKTFEQLQDTLGRTLKTIAMAMKLGERERLSPRDVANRAVALGIFDDARGWADAVRVRNELAHEYPLNAARQAEQVNAAWEKGDTLFATADAIHRFVDAERLLDGDL